MPDITRGLPGLTFESALAPNNGKVSRLDDLRESGVPDNMRYEDEPRLRFRQLVKENDELFNSIVNWRPSRNERMQAQRLGYLGTDPSDDIGLYAAEVGYGDSRFDKRITNPSQLNDIEDFRANQQSTIGILGNSIAKMGVLASTTAADSWIGLPAGLVNLVSEVANGNVESSRDILNAIVDNPVSSYLQSINDKSEEIFKNYQTAEERNRHWWENMFTANFIGDTLIKNAGFTIGAVLGGKLAVDAIGRATGVMEARDAFKGLAAELGITGKSASEVLEMLSKGTTQLEKRAALKALEESARNLKNSSLGLKIAGGLLAGTGEARIEAIQGAKEFEESIENIYGNLDVEHAAAIKELVDDMRLANMDINSPGGRAYYDYNKSIIDGKYSDIKAQIAHDKAMVANTIFALNVPLLTAGDMFQWGKLMLGGYAIDRNLVKGIKKVTDKSAIRAVAKTPEELVNGTKYAVKGNKFTNALGKIGAGSRNVLIETQEEMNQSLFSSTAKAKGVGNVTEFTERLYDPMAVHDTVSWLDAAKEGMRQSWLNKDDWVEGFAGGFMGFIGLPSISVKVDEQTKKERPRITMEGGIWSPIREYNDMDRHRREIVKNLNSRLGSKEFLNYYYGKIGNRHFDSLKEDAIKFADKNEYEKLSHAQLVNDAIMFANAGRLQDFIDIVSSFENISDETVEEIKSLFPNVEEIKKMTTPEMRGLINDNVSTMRRQLDDYIKISNNIKTIYGNSIDDNAIAELTWQTAHLDEIEYNLKELYRHPETSEMLSAYKRERGDAVKDLSDYEILSSDAYGAWLTSKFKDTKDGTEKTKLTSAISDFNDISYYMKQRASYIKNISDLSTDPEIVLNKMKKLRELVWEVESEKNKTILANTIATSDKISDLISAMEDFEDMYNGEDKIIDSILKNIKKMADSGNSAASEYLKVRDIDNGLKNKLDELAKKSGLSDDVVNKAMAAWTYLKHNTDTAFELISEHNASDVSSDIGVGDESIKLLNSAVESIAKELKVYDKIKPREIKKEAAKEENDDSNKKTQFKTTGNKLTRDKYYEIADDLVKSEKTIVRGYEFIRVDLNKGDVYFDGKPASGFIYVYFKNGNTYTGKGGGYAVPIVYDANGNEIDKADVLKLTNKDGVSLAEWVLDNNNFPAAGRALFDMRMASKFEDRFPINKKKSKRTKQDSKKTEDKDSGKKTKPHKFIAPNVDIALLGSDGQAVAEVLKSLDEDSEVRFGIESSDGPIFILAGDSNLKIGTLPDEIDGSDTYSGLSELKELIKKEYAETSDRKNADGMWVSEKYVNHIREKRDSGFVTIEDNIPINDIPGFDGIKEPIIMFVVDSKDGGQEFLFSSNSVSIDKVQFRAGGSGRIKAGFAYLLVPSGDKFIPVMLYTQNTGNVINDETKETALDLKDPVVISSGFGKRVSDTLNNIINSFENDNAKERERLFKFWAWDTISDSSPDSLQRLLHFRAKGRSRVQLFSKETYSGKLDWFDDDDVVMVINTHYEDSNDDDPIFITRGKSKPDGSEYTIREQIIDAMNDLEFVTDSGEIHNGPIVQISKAHFDGENKKDLPTRIREWVDARMLLTDVKSFDLTMPSYILDYWSVSQNKFMRPALTSERITGPASRVVIKKSKGKGSEKIAEMEINGEDVKYNLSSNQIKIGASKWFTPMTTTKSIDEKIKKLKYNSAKQFADTMRALAIIADKYGESESGDGRIGNRVLIKNFSGNHNVGFIITTNGGRFMNASELKKLEDELKGVKSTKKAKKKSEEAERVRKAREELENTPDNEDEFLQEAGSEHAFKTEEIERMKNVHNIRQAIEHLKKYAPQYSEFLDYISKIEYYDDVLIEFAKNVGTNSAHGGNTLGTNKFKFDENGSVFTNSIVISKNSFGYQTVMHELVHAFTVVALRYDNDLYEDIKSQMDFMLGSIGKSKLARELGSYEAAYAFENPYEFVAEFFSNPKLQKLAKDLVLPEQTENKKTSVFSKIINFILDKFRSLFGNKQDSFYNDLKNKLYSIVDRQVELQEEKKIIFKSNEDFEKAKKIASGASLDGVVSSTKIPTVEQNYDYRYLPMPFDDGAFVPSSESFNGPGKFLIISQLVAANDEYSSYGGMKRFVNSKNLYEYNSGGNSSLFGVKDDYSGSFVVVRAYPSDIGDFTALIKTASESATPIVIKVDPDEVFSFTQAGFHPVHNFEVNGGIFMANSSFNDEHLYKLGTTYRPFADVLDTNNNFSNLRRMQYSDNEWYEMSEMEKYHARKCIGI